MIYLEVYQSECQRNDYSDNDHAAWTLLGRFPAVETSLEESYIQSKDMWLTPVNLQLLQPDAR